MSDLRIFTLVFGFTAGGAMGIALTLAGVPLGSLFGFGFMMLLVIYALTLFHIADKDKEHKDE